MLIKECGTNSIVIVDKVEISGDSFAWDIWYIDKNNEYYQDITVDVIRSNKKVNKLITQIKKIKNKGLYFKFEYIIDVN